VSRRDLRAPLSRREFLQLVATSAAVVTAGSACPGGVALPDWPFTLGVASGDPLADRVVIWTRLAPDPLALDGLGGMPDVTVPVWWEVAHDEAFRSIVRSGVAIAHPSLAHSVHVDVNGLEPDRWYFYRFHAAGHVSPVGRMRTFPRPDQAPALARFVTASCQHFASGYYTAHAAIAEEDLDFVAFLGDYIYESGGTGPVRSHVIGRVENLAGYRHRYALYKSDANLQAAHLLCPWIITWDDHEVANNYAGDFFDENATPPQLPFLELRAAAYQAWYEHQPVRVLPPKGSGDFRIYRGFDYGDLARILVLDTRQYRSDQDCGDVIGPDCATFPNPNGTMLGAAQEAWVFDRLDASQALWNVLAQQVVFSPTPIGALRNFDQWDGYPLARQRIVDFLVDAAIRNPVILTGDIHSAGAGWLPRDTTGLTGPLASEFVATGISSTFPEALAQLAKDIIEALPHVSFFDPFGRGYCRHELARDRWRTDFRVVSTTTQPVATVSTAASFVVEDGNPVPQPA